MPRVAATAASAARSAPVRSPDPLSAHAVWIQTPKATTGRPARRAAAAPRAATASHWVNWPSRIIDISSALAISATILSSGSVTSEATWSTSVGGPSRITGGRLAPGGAEQDVHPQPQRRVRRQ